MCFRLEETLDQNMRLISHNILKCNVKGVENGYPLKLNCENMEDLASETPDLSAFTVILTNKLNLSAVKSAATDLSFNDVVEILDIIGVEDKSAIGSLSNEQLETLRHFLFDINIIDGSLTCPETGRVFVIKDGIPNMLLHEDEVA